MFRRPVSVVLQLPDLSDGIQRSDQPVQESRDADQQTQQQLCDDPDQPEKGRSQNEDGEFLPAGSQQLPSKGDKEAQSEHRQCVIHGEGITLHTYQYGDSTYDQAEDAGADELGSCSDQRIHAALIFFLCLFVLQDGEARITQAGRVLLCTFFTRSLPAALAGGCGLTGFMVKAFHHSFFLRK